MAAIGNCIGSQVPALYWVPESVSNRGDRAIAFLKVIGFELDPWQQLVLRDLLGETIDHKWACKEAVLLVPRQNGKTAITEARILCGLFLFGDKLIIHTAQQYDTAFESYLRVISVINNCPGLARYVKGTPRGAGRCGVELHHPKCKTFAKNCECTGGARLLYKARGSGSGRGFSGDLVILDEAYDLDPDMMADLIPALSARKNPQVIYTSSTGHEKSTVLMKVRDRGLRHESSISLHEWCADKGCDLDDREQWYKANPAMGIRVDEDWVQETERGSMDEQKFARERLGLWADSATYAPIDADMWHSRCRCAGDQHPEHKDVPKSEIVSRYVVAVDAAPDRSMASVAIAGFTAEGLKQVEVLESGRGISWCIQYIDELYKAKINQPPLAVCVQSGARAGSLIPELEALEVEVIPFSTREIMGATGHFQDSVKDGTLVHLGDGSVAAGLSGARKYNIGGKVGEDEYNGWGWARVDTSVDITGVCAISYALWGLNIKRAEAVVEKKPYEGKPRGGRVW